MFKLILLLISLLLAIGCAAPREFDQTGGFVPEREVQIVGLTREGLSYYKQSRFIEAELKLRQALYLAPDADNLKNNLALALLSSGQIAEGEAMLAELSRKFPQSSRYQVDVAEARARRNEFLPALETFSAAMKRAIARGDFGTIATILRSIAVTQFNFGEELDALCSSQEAFNLKNDQTEMVRHTRMLLALNMNDEAMSLLHNASNTNRLLQQDPEVLRLLAMSNYGKENYAQAQAFVERATDVSKALPEIQSSLKAMTELLNHKLGNELDSEYKFAELGTYERLFWPINMLKDYETRVLADRGQ